ncbi:biotin/lipoyl-containing protein, partial [Gilvimarinus sp. 1_MG-2023]
STAGEVAASGDGDPVCAPLSGNVWKVLVDTGDQVEEGDVVVILEAMKMETEVRAPRAGTVTGVSAKEGVSVKVGDTLYNLA